MSSRRYMQDVAYEAAMDSPHTAAVVRLQGKFKRRWFLLPQSYLRGGLLQPYYKGKYHPASKKEFETSHQSDRLFDCATKILYKTTQFSPTTSVPTLQAGLAGKAIYSALLDCAAGHLNIIVKHYLRHQSFGYEERT